MSTSRDVSSVRRRAALGLAIVLGTGVAAACVPNSAAPGTTVSTTTSLSYSQVACIARQGLDGLANDRPPTIDEIVRVLNAATACGFTAPRGYAAQYYEHSTGRAAPRTTAAPSSVPYLESTQVKCIADQGLADLSLGAMPTRQELERAVAAAGTCGVQLA